MHITTLKSTSKIIGVIVVLAFALGVTILGGRQAANYFAKASTCSTQKISTAQVTANSAVVSWETTDVTQGRIEYGTNPTNLTFTAPEATSGKTHNVPLTLLTPNTVYYYLIAIGDNRCDSSGQACTSNCVPYSFTTSAITPQAQDVVTMTPKVEATPTSIQASPTLSIASPSATVPTVSTFCQQVQVNIGKTSLEATSWATVKQYDLNNDGVINGRDMIKCQEEGK